MLRPGGEGKCGEGVSKLVAVRCIVSCMHKRIAGSGVHCLDVLVEL